MEQSMFYVRPSTRGAFDTTIQNVQSPTTARPRSPIANASGARTLDGTTRFGPLSAGASSVASSSTKPYVLLQTKRRSATDEARPSADRGVSHVRSSPSRPKEPASRKDVSRSAEEELVSAINAAAANNANERKSSRESNAASATSKVGHSPAAGGGKASARPGSSRSVDVHTEGSCAGPS